MCWAHHMAERANSPVKYMLLDAANAAHKRADDLLPFNGTTAEIVSALLQEHQAWVLAGDSHWGDARPAEAAKYQAQQILIEA